MELPLSKYIGVQYDAVLVVVDQFIKMAHYIPTKGDLKAQGLANLFIKEVIKLHGPIVYCVKLKTNFDFQILVFAVLPFGN